MLAKLTLRRRWQLSIILRIGLMILLCSGLWWWSGLPDRQLVYTVTAVGPLDQVAISPDSQFVATAAEDGTIQLWYLQDGAPLHSLNGHAGSAAIALHPDSTQLVSAGADGTVRLWQVATGQSPTTLWPPAGVAPAPPAAALISQISADEPFTAVTFSLDGQLIAAGTGNRWVVIFQASTGQVVSIFQAYPELAKLSRILSIIAR